MEIIIQHYWSKETRKEQIDNFINILALDLYEKCKLSNSIDSDTLENINLDLCVAYVKKLITYYIKNLDYGSLQIDLYEQDVLNIANLANDFRQTVETSN